MLRARPLSPLLLSALLACAGDDGATAGTTQTSADTTSTGEATTTTGDPSSTTDDGTATGVDEGCLSHAVGEWNACNTGPLTYNSVCNAAPGSSTTTGLLPAGGGGNVCSVNSCVDACDCFAPPATGDAVVTCAPVLADGNACVLYCAGGQTCPDGMGCKSGY